MTQVYLGDHDGTTLNSAQSVQVDDLGIGEITVNLGLLGITTPGLAIPADAGEGPMGLTWESANAAAPVTNSGTVMTDFLRGADQVIGGINHQVWYTDNNPVIRPVNWQGQLVGAIFRFTVFPNTDITAPEFVVGTVDGGVIRLYYSENLDVNSVPVADDFEVAVTSRLTGAQSTVQVTSVAVAGNLVTLDIESDVVDGDTVLIDYTAGTNPIQDQVGNDVVNLVDQGLVNATTTPLDLDGPVFLRGVVNRTVLHLYYSEELVNAADSTPQPSDFVVDDAGTMIDVMMVSIMGSVVTLSLATAVAYDDIVTLSYTPGDNALRDLAFNLASALVTQSVANATPSPVDLADPELLVATAEESTIRLYYNEPLVVTQVPSLVSFRIEIDDVSYTPTAIHLVSNVVSLTSPEPVRRGDSVTLTYTPPANNPLVDQSGNPERALVDQEVENLHGAIEFLAAPPALSDRIDVGNYSPPDHIDVTPVTSILITPYSARTADLIGRLPELRDHISLDHTDDDNLLRRLLASATQKVGDYTGWPMRTGRHHVRAYWSHTPVGRRVLLPGPVIPSTIRVDGQFVDSVVAARLPHDALIELPEDLDSRGLFIDYDRAWNLYYTDPDYPEAITTAIYRIAATLYLYREATVQGDRPIRRILDTTFGKNLPVLL